MGTGTKFYKLGQSNELAIIGLLTELKNDRDLSSKKIDDTVIKIIQISISSLVTFFVSSQSNFRFLFGIEDQTVYSVCVIFIVPIIFLLFLYVFHFIMDRIKGYFIDTTNTEEGIEYLKNFFYKKVLNEIVLGFSLEKQYSDEANIRLKKLYLHETLYHFVEAGNEIHKAKLLQSCNIIEAINPYLLMNLFTLIENILEKMEEMVIVEFEGSAEEFKRESHFVKAQLKELSDMYNIYQVKVLQYINEGKK